LGGGADSGVFPVSDDDFSSLSLTAQFSSRIKTVEPFGS
jgi:hypothetical protein